MTVFSAPNYCDVYRNKGAIIKFTGDILNIRQYDFSPHPYVLPNFMDIFSWSLPFVIEKVLELLHNMIKPRGSSDSIDQYKGVRLKEMEVQMKYTKNAKFKNKVKAISKMIKLFRILRSEHEIIVKLKGLCPDNKLPTGLLVKGKEALISALESFYLAKKWDKNNEKRPE